ncbi:Beta-lactamase enzyme family protein [Aquimarina spongiae]|uniref:Beta-lactamase enzyme family protein n=1 Tax=Aquimarina spongiae TaxID=570521 RepID=A0A1M6CMB8_9FLAO|nr:Beta-lactamase enzyme family protein [Aquimarina spongiae]
MPFAIKAIITMKQIKNLVSKKILSKLFLLLVFPLCILSCSKKSPLDTILYSDSEIINKVISNVEDHEVQIIYSQIHRDEEGNITFEDYQYNVSDSVYFYPASTVKLPVALLALEKLNELQKQGVPIDLHTHFKTQNDTLYSNLEKEIEKIFGVSSNLAYNRLFEFLGQDDINKRLAEKNIPGSISHRLSAFFSHNPKTQSIVFKQHLDDSIPVYVQNTIENKIPSKLTLQRTQKGIGYIYNDSLMQKPKDFSEKNYLPLSSLHGIMKRIHFPELFPENQQFRLTKSDSEFITQTMKRTPADLGFDKSKYYDAYGKFFMFGDSKKNIPQHIQIHNKVGYAYGYLTDCAYIMDTKNNVEFLLSATIHVNQNRIFNDDQYEYKEIGIPFLAELGRQIHDYELNRKRQRTNIHQ